MGKPGGKRSLARPRHRWEDNINPLHAKLNPICNFLALLRAHCTLHVRRIGVKMVLQEVGFGSMVWIELTQDRDRRRVLVNAVMNLRVP